MRKVPLFILSLVILFSSGVYSQDRQNWDQAVGGKTALLGGIDIAGVRDYSATFYNPGALGFLDKDKLSVNFNMYGIKDFKFIDGGGPGINSRYTRVSLFPSSLAGSIPFLGDSVNRFSFMIYGNSYSYVRSSERYEGFADVIPSRPSSVPGIDNLFEGDEFLINQGKLDFLLQEVTVCFGYSRRISDNVGIGFTLLGAYRDQTNVRNEYYSAFDTTYQRSATTNISTEVDYWALRFAGKFGMQAEWDRVKLGVTLTTPSLPMKFASGATDGASFSSNNVKVLVDSTTNQLIPVDILASDRQEGLSSSYRTPLSVSAGIEYSISELSKIHLAGEWFAPLSTYIVIQPESHGFIRNIPPGIRPVNSADLLKVYDSMKSIFNFGIAYEHRINNKITGYAAVRTDFSTANEIGKNKLTVGITDINIYHFTLGTSYSAEDSFISLGFEYSYGVNSKFNQIFNFPAGSVSEGDYILGTERNTCRAIYKNINLFFGVTRLL